MSIFSSIIAMIITTFNITSAISKSIIVNVVISDVDWSSTGEIGTLIIEVMCNRRVALFSLVD